MKNNSLAYILAEKSLGFKMSNLSSKRALKVRWCVADFLCNVAAASKLEETRLALTLSTEGDISVFGFEKSFDVKSAALVMGTAGAMLQSHDVFQGGGNHPSSAIISSAKSE